MKNKLLILAGLLAFACTAAPDFGPAVPQRAIPRVEKMAAFPQPYRILDWKQKALDFDAYAFDFNSTLPAGPVIWLDSARRNMDQVTFGLYTAMKDARLSYQKQLNTLEDTELALNVQYRQLVYNLRTAIDKYIVQKQNVDVAGRVFDNIALKYENGVASSMDVTNAGTSLITAQSGYVQSLLEIISARISLEQLLNK